MAKEKVLITVKTYPVISETHTELACTAGLREDGTWIRLYPIPFRLLGGDQKYEKYQWIEVDIEKSTKDQRPESYKVIDIDRIKLLNKVEPGKDWAERRKLVLEGRKIYANKKEIIDLAHKNDLSLVVFKPQKILDVTIEEAIPEWSPDKLKVVQDNMRQGHLFDGQNPDDFKPVKKLPFKFRYKFIDNAGVESHLMIEDWELGALYWNCHAKYGDKKAAELVRQQYLDIATKRDAYLFLGTTNEWHAKKAPRVLTKDT